MRLLSVGYEELTSIRVGPTIRHRKYASCIVLKKGKPENSVSKPVTYLKKQQRFDMKRQI